MLTGVTSQTTDGADEDLLDGRYRLGERLGAGGVAEVFAAVDVRLDRAVAIKLFRGDAADQLQRHEAEMRTLASLDHPSLVTVFDAGVDPAADRPYLVMQLVDGSTLQAELGSGALDALRVARYGAALADALAYVHARGLVHRDVKPANVLLSADGRVHLADFGIARLVDSAHVTKTGDVLGTPAYFAPEQVAGEPVGPPADIYALGLVLLECLTGSRPYQGTAVEVAMARLSKPPDIPALLGPAWVDLLTAMTDRSPVARPAATAVADRLRAMAELGADATVAVATPMTAATQVVATPTSVTSALPPVVATPVTQTGVAAPAAYDGPRRTPGWVWALVAVLLVAAIAVGAAVALHSSSNSTFKPGSPTLHTTQQENDMQQLEKDVQ